MVMPIASKSALQLWYVRPDNFLELDPLALALVVFTCELRVSAKFPHDAEWAGLDGMIVAGLRAGVSPLVSNDVVQALQTAGCPESCRCWRLRRWAKRPRKSVTWHLASFPFPLMNCISG